MLHTQHSNDENDETEVVGKKVIIVGVVAKPALNGQSGRVEAYASQQVEMVIVYPCPSSLRVRARARWGLGIELGLGLGLASLHPQTN